MLSDFHSVVSEFFDEQGWSAPATLVRKFSSYNPSKSEASVGEERIFVKIIVFDYVSKTDNNTLIKTGDKHVYMVPVSTLSTVNPATDYLEMLGKKYKVITSRQVQPDLADTFYYELYVRA